jgi:thiopeptide-type bacteriocin biosynthesis protein
MREPVRSTLVSGYVLRAPLLPASALDADVRRLARAPEVAAALAGASADLAAAGDDAAAWAARRRYLRRAAFRPTPQGPWAGVCVGSLGARTRVATGKTRLVTRPTWAALAALGRSLLDEPTRLAGVRLRCTPSLLWRHDRLTWLAPGAGGEPAEVRHADGDQLLEVLLDACEDWCAWSDARAVARHVEPADDDAIDELLRTLVDDGLLVHDLEPPLVGPPPEEWLRARLLALSGNADEVDAWLATLARRHTVLVHEPRTPPTLAEAACARAAALAPVLWRLQDTLAPPAAERVLDPGLPAALAAITAPLGAGALDLAALALGDYGVSLPGHDHEAGAEAAPATSTPPAALLALLVDRFAAALAVGAPARFDAEELDAVLPEGTPPASFELVLAPRREPRGAPPGDGWMLGLHAPAGASWGRFCEALGAPLHAALAELAEAERTWRPGEAALDLAWHTAAELADLAQHPPTRAATLALTSWPEGAARTLTPADLELVADEAALAPLALREAASTRPLAPAPLARVRSTFAPRGLYRLLAGWSLWRQHAPWAFSAGPLAGLARTPRVEIDGFVVAPASWAAPPEEALVSPAALRRWRRSIGAPRHVQVGQEDELLPVDLDAAWAPDELRRTGEARWWEIWPPLGEEIDAGGRRVEAIVACVSPASEHEAAAHAATALAGRVAPPTEPAPLWRTFKLYGAAERADRVLAGAVGPAVHEARAAGEIDAWFFLRYLEDGRPHLRLRAHAGTRAGLDRFGRRLEAALQPARAAGDIVVVETGDYHRETSRYGALATMAAVERVWEAESELALELLDTGAVSAGEGAEASFDDHDPAEAVVLAMDALAAGLGLDPAARAQLAARRRDAHGVPRGEGDPYASTFRRVQRRLGDALADARHAPAAFATQRERVAAARSSSALPGSVAQTILPALVHLTANRLVGTAPDLEARACYFWERALDGVLARARNHKANGKPKKRPAARG